MSNNTIKVISILFVIMVILFPMGWILVSTEPPGQYYETASSQVQAALKATGLSFCDQTESKWNVSGATGGFTICISDDCSVKDSGIAVYLHTQDFNTVESRNSAVRLVQKSINMNDINGAVYTYGSYVVVVQGPTGGKPIAEIVSQVKAGLKK